MEDQVLNFQEILVQVQDSLSQNEVLDLVFLCSEILKKDLSCVVTARDLFSMLQNHDLLCPNDSSLLIELLKMIKRDKLIRELQLNPQLSSSRVSLYRQMLFKLSENISDDELQNIKFMLSQSLPRKKLQQDVTILQLFLEMEKGGCLAADNLGLIERIIGAISPNLKKIIQLYQTECGLGAPTEVKSGDKPDSLETSVTRAVPPEGSAVALYHQELLPPSYFSQLQSTEIRSLRKYFSGDAVQSQFDRMTISDKQNLTQSEETLSVLEQNPKKLVNLERYNMSGDWRGFALIINNHDFLSCSKMKNRDGTEIDLNILVSVFQWLGFETVVRQNCSKKNMLKALDELSKRDHTQADCVVCCVLTHGYEGGLYGVDGGSVSITELLELLDGTHCRSLLKKPKLFFIQACQGQQEQQGANLQSDASSNTAEMGLFCDAKVPREDTPVAADYLVAMATVPGYVSFREKVRGTWFIQTLCEKLQQLVPSGVDLLSILTEVNRDVSKKADRNGTRKQMPQPQFTLTKIVVFPIPSTPKPS